MQGAICYRPLAEADLPLVADWLNRRHLRRFFQPMPISLAEVEAKYGPRIRGEVPTHSSLALLDGAPFGYLQCYRVVDWPEFQATVGVGEGISIDPFISEPALIGKGLGRRMMAGYIEKVAFPLYPAEQLCWIGHEIENTRAQPALKPSALSPSANMRKRAGVTCCLCEGASSIERRAWRSGRRHGVGIARRSIGLRRRR
jgi:hypothetical protein